MDVCRYVGYGDEGEKMIMEELAWLQVNNATQLAKQEDVLAKLEKSYTFVEECVTKLAARVDSLEVMQVNMDRDLKETMQSMQKLQSTEVDRLLLTDALERLSDMEVKFKEFSDANKREKSKDLSFELEQFQNSIESLKQRQLVLVNEKADKTDLQSLLQSKVDKSDLKKVLSENLALQNEQVEMKKTMQILCDSLQNKTDLNSVKTTITEVRDDVLHAVQVLHTNTQKAVGLSIFSCLFLCRCFEGEHCFQSKRGRNCSCNRNACWL